MRRQYFVGALIGAVVVLAALVAWFVVERYPLGEFESLRLSSLTERESKLEIRESALRQLEIELRKREDELAALERVARGQKSPNPTASPTSPPVPPPLPSAPAVRPLDSALKQMLSGHIAFNNPEQMRVGDTGEVQAILSITVPADDLIKSLTAEGKKESASLQVSDHMQATLTGGGAFDVAPTGPQTQWVTSTGMTTWHWLVTPKLTGKQFLTLTVDAIIMIEGQKDTRNITTLTREIEVEVARPHNEEEWFTWIKDRVEAFGWGWGVVVVVAGTAVGFWRKIMRWLRPPPMVSAKPPDDEKDG